MARNIPGQQNHTHSEHSELNWTPTQISGSLFTLVIHNLAADAPDARTRTRADVMMMLARARARARLASNGESGGF